MDFSDQKLGKMEKIRFLSHDLAVAKFFFKAVRTPGFSWGIQHDFVGGCGQLPQKSQKDIATSPRGGCFFVKS